MSKYRHIGTLTEICDTPFKFDRFGQLAEIPDELAKHAIADGAPLLPAADFDKIGFTEDELKKFADPRTHVKATDDFKQKRLAVWKVFHHEPVAHIEPHEEQHDPVATPATPEVK